MLPTVGAVSAKRSGRNPATLKSGVAGVEEVNTAKTYSFQEVVRKSEGKTEVN